MTTEGRMTVQAVNRRLTTAVARVRHVGFIVGNAAMKGTNHHSL
jgi:hypothetical protein